MENETKADSREWELDAETEYRFELDPGTSLAIKVRQILLMEFRRDHQLLYSSFMEMQRFLAQSLPKASSTCLAPNAKHPFLLGKGVRWR